MAACAATTMQSSLCPPTNFGVLAIGLLLMACRNPKRRSLATSIWFFALPVRRAQEFNSFLAFDTRASNSTVPHPSSSCEGIADEVSRYAIAGRLSLARSAATQGISTYPECEKQIARSYVEAADAMLQLAESSSSLVTVLKSHQDHGSLYHIQPHDKIPCWHGGDDLDVAIDRWDSCCSDLVDRRASRKSGGASNSDCRDETSGLPLCCDFFNGSPSHLRLPALREVALNIRISIEGGDANTSTNLASCEADDSNTSVATISLEQDGFLRPFDVSSILWPAGYLLALCVASPDQCGAIEVSQAIEDAIAEGKREYFGIELGAGIGLSSIALSLYIQGVLPKKETQSSDITWNNLVLATDTAMHALVLAKVNTERNHAEIDIARLDYNNSTQLKRIASMAGGFAVVIGSSLQAFFDNADDSAAPIWTALDILLDKSNPNAVALFCHTRSEPIKPPRDGRFERLRTISGDEFNMRTRAGESSDFEISVFGRQA